MIVFSLSWLLIITHFTEIFSIFISCKQRNNLQKWLYQKCSSTCCYRKNTIKKILGFFHFWCPFLDFCKLAMTFQLILLLQFVFFYTTLLMQVPCVPFSNLRNAIIIIYYHQEEFNFMYIDWAKPLYAFFQEHQETKEEEEEKVDILQLFAKAQERYNNEVSDWWVCFSFSLIYNISYARKIKFWLLLSANCKLELTILIFQRALSSI